VEPRFNKPLYMATALETQEQATKTA